MGLALIAAAVRLWLQVQRQRRLRLDDGLLVVACACLIAATVICYHIMDYMYMNVMLATEPTMAMFFMTPHFLEKSHWYQALVYAFLDLDFTAIFAVKFCFLHFFRALVDRQKNMLLHWRLVLGFTIVAYGFAICTPFMECPRFGVEASQSSFVS